MTAAKKQHIIKLSMVYILCTIMTLCVIIPFALVIINSFKSVSEAAIINFSLPEKFLFENYLYVIKEGNLIRAFGNSMFITCTVVFFTVILASMTAFVIGRREDRFGKFTYSYFLIGLIAPLALIPEVVIVKLLGLNGTYFAPILIHIAVRLPLSVMLYTGFIKGIPVSLDECAMLDGCSPLRMFFSIIFPLLKPVIFTNVILTFMAVWNDFQISLYFLSDSKMQTLPLGIYNFVGFMTYKWNYVCAFIIITILPIVVVYLLAQKYIIEGMVAGAVKG